MSEQQLERLQALLAKVQKNQRPKRPGGEADVVGESSQELRRVEAEPVTAAVPAPPLPPEPPSASLRRPPLEPRVDPRVEPGSRRATSLEKAFEAEPAPAERARPAAAAARPDQAAAGPIVPRVIEPDPPRASARPIAQLVSKHAPAVDATFGAMLKRSLSLRPH